MEDLKAEVIDIPGIRRKALAAVLRTAANTAICLVDAFPIAGNAASIGELGNALMRMAGQAVPAIKKYSLTPDISSGAVGLNVVMDGADVLTGNLIPGSTTFLPFAIMQLWKDAPRILNGIRTFTNPKEIQNIE